ncbi:polyprenol monophosphomannose synthase [Candidatus Bathyarchaeota archaeon]|nr:polyprenol monophosphomannose synthase [Candidatus Bathyarchaeota archaeon]
MQVLKDDGINGAVGSKAITMLPTYCEAENIKNLICEIESLGIDSDILVIDDSSPDETGNIVGKLRENYPNITLLTRPRKAGLGTAITDGFRFILSQADPPDYIVVMDADYSHSPQDIPRLLRKAREGYDVVVGSRYCQGGRVKGWNLRRLIISRVANKATAKLVSLPINDFTSGFRCYSKEYVKKVLPSLHSQTYEIQIETLRQARIQKARVTETSITFTNRKKGKSKLSQNEIWSFLLYALKTTLKSRTGGQ